MLLAIIISSIVGFGLGLGFHNKIVGQIQILKNKIKEKI